MHSRHSKTEVNHDQRSWRPLPVQRVPLSEGHHLKGIDFPADKEHLLQQAKKNGAEAEVLDTIKQLPEEQYESMADVMKGYGQVH